MFRVIYLSPLGRIISFVMRILGRLLNPFMIYGYWNSHAGKFRKRTRISSSTVLINKRSIDIGDDCWIGHHSIVDGSNGVKIGKGVQIAGLSGIYSHSSHLAIRLCGERYIEMSDKVRPGYIRAPVEIGDFTFIGVSAVILPGVKIGKGCIIGAGSIVNCDIPDRSVAVGNPVKIIGSTLDLDASYFEDSIVMHSYYDPHLIEEHKKNSLKADHVLD
jgi:acetyltransferase-like isoleucine patch superfamily enzyme